MLVKPQLSPLDVWTELNEILLREYATEDGRMLRIGATAIDSGGHHTDAVYKFCNRRIGRHVYAVKGRAGPRPMWPIRAGKSKKFKGTKVWMVGVDTAKDAIYTRLRISTPGPGYCHFPASYNETYFKQLTSEKVHTKFVKGFPVREWYKELGTRNEALDRRVYAMCALHSRTVPWEVFARHAPNEPPPAKHPSAGEAPSASRSSPPPPRGGRKIRMRIGT